MSSRRDWRRRAVRSPASTMPPLVISTRYWTGAASPPNRTAVCGAASGSGRPDRSIGWVEARGTATPGATANGDGFWKDSEESPKVRLETVAYLSGTDGSNPFPSSGESANHRFRDRLSLFWAKGLSLLELLDLADHQTEPRDVALQFGCDIRGQRRALRRG